MIAQRTTPVNCHGMMKTMSITTALALNLSASDGKTNIKKLDGDDIFRYEIPPSCKRRAGVYSCDAINYAELTTAKKYLNAVRNYFIETVNLSVHF